jgi:hypothetical protein
MIVSDAAEASQVLDALTELAAFSVLSPELQALCGEIMQTVAAPAFPGALVPTLDSAGVMYVNVATAKVGDWRRLKPILLSFAGPTMTGFEGIPGPLLPGDAAGQILMGTGPAVTAVMPLPANANLRIQALRALARARATLERRRSLQAGFSPGSRTISMSGAATRPRPFWSGCGANCASTPSTSNFSRYSSTLRLATGPQFWRSPSLQISALHVGPLLLRHSCWRPYIRFI